MVSSINGLQIKRTLSIVMIFMNVLAVCCTGAPEGVLTQCHGGK